MKILFGILFLACSCSAQTTYGFSIVEIYKSIARKSALLIENGFSGYNPNLSSEQVVKLYCAKPSDKVFREVYFDDPQMATKFDMTKPMGFVMHGWTDTGNETWIIKLAQAWIDNHDTNVCRVDWSIYSLVEYTVAALRNVNLVAKHLSKFITSLHDVYGIAYSNVTLIGHSLGGQICGRTGSNVGGQIGRIIAMDPASPLFRFPISVSKENQLDEGDALFVTVVHSNSYIAGVGPRIGHADYFPHGGASIQPGCVFPFLFGIYNTEIFPVTCSHLRSIRFVHLAMNNDPLCRAIKCDTRGDYLKKQCTDITDTWGINSNKTKGDFYFWAGFNPKCRNKFWAF